jgi:hypothetical protein
MDEFIRLMNEPEARKIVSEALDDHLVKLAQAVGQAPRNKGATRIATGRLMLAIKLWESLPTEAT